MFEFLNRVDWKLLHRQKRVLVKQLSCDTLKAADAEALWGIVHLIDALQDDAVSAGRWTFPGERTAKGGRHARKT